MATEYEGGASATGAGGAEGVGPVDSTCSGFV